MKIYIPTYVCIIYIPTYVCINIVPRIKIVSGLQLYIATSACTNKCLPLEGSLGHWGGVGGRER